MTLGVMDLCYTLQGGSVISTLRQESGARIKVDAELPGCTERLVILASPDDPPDVPLCRAQQALLAVHARMADADAASILAQEGDILAVRSRLLVVRLSSVSPMV